MTTRSARAARLWTATTAALLASALAGAANAQSPTAAPQSASPGTGVAGVAGAGEWSDAEVIERTAWIQSRLDAEAPAAGLWFRFWVLTSAGTAVVQTVLASAFDDPQQRPAFLVGAITSLVGASSLLALPATPVFAGEDLRALPPATTPAERRARLRTAETLLRRAGDTEAFGRSWLAQAGTFAVAITGSLVLWLAYDLPVRALINLGVILAAGELRFFTQPTGLIDAARRYRAGTWRERASGPRATAMPLLLPTGFGLGASVVF